MFKRVREGLSDAAETLRRLFRDPEVRGARLALPEPPAHGAGMLAVEARPGLEAWAPRCTSAGLLDRAPELGGLPAFEVRAQSEGGWDAWAQRGRALAMEPLTAAGKGLAVPALPREAARRSADLGLPTPKAGRRTAEGWTVKVRSAPPRPPAPRSRGGLDLVLRLPMPFPGRDLDKVPKGQWMKYSLELVRGTGENIRNLELVGVYTLPRKGVLELRMDPRANRLLVHLEKVALEAPRRTFLLARRKSDQALLSCYVDGD